MYKIILTVIICGLLLTPCTFEVCAEQRDNSEKETSETTETLSGINEQLIDNIDNGLGDYWDEEAAELSRIKNPEEHWAYGLAMSASNICKKGLIPISLLAIGIGYVLRVASGMHKPLKKTGTLIMIGIPIVAIILAYGVPITASIFYYGR